MSSVAMGGLSVGIMLVCAACASRQSLDDPALVATAEYLEQSPLPTPEFFILDERRHTVHECFEINGIPLWEPGDGFANETYVEGLKSRVVVLVDNTVVPPQNLEISIHLAPAYVFDREGNVIGTSVFLPSCILADYLAAGLHIATVEVTTTSGIKHFYTWAFRVANETPSELPTLAVLPSLTPSAATP